MKNFADFITEANDPPMVLVLKRKGIRNFAGGQRVALYHSDTLGLDFSVPYGTDVIPAVSSQVTEEVLTEDYGKAAKMGMGFPKATMDLVRKTQDMEYYHPKTAERRHGTLVKKDTKGYHVKDQATGDVHRFRYFNRIGHTRGAQQLDKHHPENKRVDEQQLQESAMHKINMIADKGQEDIVIFQNGASSRVHPVTAKAILDLQAKINSTNKVKLAQMVNSSPIGLEKVARFAIENIGN